MDKIEIRYLQQGLVKVDKPKDWDAMTSKQKAEYCENILYSLDDRTLLEGMAESYPFDIDCFFADTPRVEAIELSEDSDDDPVLIASTETWDKFIEDSGGLSWKSSQET